MVKKRKINNKIFNKTKKNIEKNSDFLNLHLSLSDVKKLINKKNEILSEIEVKALIIKSKIELAPKNIKVENIIEDLPAVTLCELNGDFSRKLRYKDLYELHKMNKKTSEIIEEQENLKSREKIISIELLQKQIDILLNGN